MKQYGLKGFEDDKNVQCFVDYHDYLNVNDPRRWRVYGTRWWAGSEGWQCWNTPSVDTVTMPQWYLIKLQIEHEAEEPTDIEEKEASPWKHSEFKKNG